MRIAVLFGILCLMCYWLIWTSVLLTNRQNKKLEQKNENVHKTPDIKHDPPNTQNYWNDDLELNFVVSMQSLNNTLQTFLNTKERLDKLKIKFNFHVFGNEPINVNEPNFRFTNIQDDLIKKNFIKGDKNYISIFRNFHEYCIENDIKVFLLMQDDVMFCNFAFPHLIMLYGWAMNNLNDWITIRTATGMNGLLLQCKDLPNIIEQIENDLIHEPNKPSIEKTLSDWWTNSNSPKRYFVYRFNLMHFIHSNRGLKCFEEMTTFINEKEQFDEWQCGKFIISPCDHVPNLEIFEHYTGTHKSKLPLTHQPLMNLIQSLKIFILFGEQKVSCNQVCTLNQKICVEEVFPIINDCSIILKYMKMRWPNIVKEYCVSYDDMYYKNRPSINRNYYIIRVVLDEKRFSCNEIGEKHERRVCPCL